MSTYHIPVHVEMRIPYWLADLFPTDQALYDHLLAAGALPMAPRPHTWQVYRYEATALLVYGYLAEGTWPPGAPSEDSLPCP